MRKFTKIIIYYLLGTISILALSVFPKYFQMRDFPEGEGYFFTLFSFLSKEFFQKEGWVYTVNGVDQEPILDVLWPAFIYSIEILVCAILLGCFVAFILSLSSFFLPQFLLQPLKRFLDLIESIPDIIIATLLQALVVVIYKKTGVEIFTVASYSENAYLGPIITLSILPAISLFKILILMMEEEYLKDYVTFARSKGIRNFPILWKHIIRNIIPVTFQHMKIIIWGLLSSQFIIERLFNVHGFTYFLLENFTPITIAVSLLFIFTPFFILFQLVDILIHEEQEKARDVKKGLWRQRMSFSYLLLSLKVFGSNLRDGGRRFSWKNFSLIHPLSWLGKIVALHMKNWKVAVGSLFFIVVIGYSIIYSVTTNNHIDQMRLFYAEDGVTLISAMPFAPTEPFFFGSDRLGYSLFDQIVIGAKHTLIFALLIAFLRVVGGLLLAVIYSFYLKHPAQQWIAKMVDSIHFMPLSLIAYILLTPILLPGLEGFSYSFWERVFLETMILTLLVVPLTTVLLGKEINRVSDYEFIASAKVMGGGKFQILIRHILPHLGPRLTILFGQQFIQVLLIFMHLGIFDYFFGGTKLSMEQMFPDPPQSTTYEWSGLIGQVGRGAIGSGQFWYLYILVPFVIAIFAMQLIVQGVKEVQQVKVGVVFKQPGLRKNKEIKQSKEAAPTITKESFTQIGRDPNGNQAIRPR
ncbi:ABC transporter permease subunit [Bacillus circulans]|uniref:ABC transporter permease subunit n=1 Tax=Niallia circulans TaxID=1397 RepID=UPI00155F9B6E|nr:ABC transporter permease subunit [Niallia circulans]NRG26814.1 ABC transporter permease subunit [Niallia circulans]